MSAIVYPYNLQPGTPNLSAQVMANFNAVAAVVNGNLDATNFKLNAGITVGQLNLSPGGLAYNQAGSGTQTWGSGETGDSVPRVAMTTDKGIQFSAGGVSSPDVEITRSATSTLQINNLVGGPANLDLNGGTLLNASISFSSIAVLGTLASGTNGGTTGSIRLNGSTSGHATISVQPVAGTTVFTLPVGNGSPGQVLVTDGAGNLSYATIGGVSQVIGPFSMPTASNILVSHALGVVPTFLAVLATCISTDGPFSPGNTAYLSGDASSQAGLGAQNLNASQLSLVTNFSTFIAGVSITPSKWVCLLFLQA